MATYTQADIDKALSAKGTGNYTAEQIASSNALLAKGDALGKSTGQQYNPQYTTYQPQAISATQMNQPQQPMQFTPYQPPQTPAPVQSIEDILKEHAQASPEATAAQTSIDSSLANIEALFQKEGTKSAREGELKAQEGIPDLKKNLNQLNAQINAINSSAFQATQNAEGRLAPTFAIFGEQAQIERQKSAQTYGLSAAAAAVTGQIALAQENVQTALDAEFGHIESMINWQKTLLDDARADKTEANTKQTERLSLKLAERERLLTEQKEARSNVYNIMLKAAEMGADPLVLRNIFNAKTPEEALQLAASAGALVSNTFKTQNDANGNLVEFELDPQGRVISSRVLSSKTQAQTPGADVVAPYGSDDYWTQLFSGSKGGKALTGDQTTPLTKAAIVVNQVGELAEQIRSTNTDPIVGILRDNNPYDVKARLIQAQLRATVPNLARGVYGEVGVLTDTDIANYIQTLPNIRTPQEANDLILGMTLRTIQNSFRSYLETYANSGRDVSGFVKQYEALGEQVKKLTSIQTTNSDFKPYNQSETNDLTFNATPSQSTGGLVSGIQNFWSWLMK
jgi:hypothetical protein